MVSVPVFGLRNLRKWGFAGFAGEFPGCSPVLDELEALAWSPGFGVICDDLHRVGVFASEGKYFLTSEAVSVPQSAQCHFTAIFFENSDEALYPFALSLTPIRIEQKELLLNEPAGQRDSVVCCFGRQRVIMCRIAMRHRVKPYGQTPRLLRPTGCETCNIIHVASCAAARAAFIVKIAKQRVRLQRALNAQRLIFAGVVSIAKCAD
jgi:hypothetical protein